jgi:hypothetical protein
MDINQLPNIVGAILIVIFGKWVHSAHIRDKKRKENRNGKN